MLTKKQIARYILIYLVIVIISIVIASFRELIIQRKVAKSAEPGKNVAEIFNEAKSKGYNQYWLTKKGDEFIFFFGKIDDSLVMTDLMCSNEEKKECNVSISKSINGNKVINANVGGLSSDGELWMNYTVEGTTGAYTSSYDISGTDAKELKTVEGDCWSNATFDEIPTFSDITDSTIEEVLNSYFPTDSAEY